MRRQQHTSVCSQQLFIRLWSPVSKPSGAEGTAAHAVHKELTNTNPTLLRVALCTATRIACNAESFIEHAGFRASAT